MWRIVGVLVAGLALAGTPTVVLADVADQSPTQDGATFEGGLEEDAVQDSTTDDPSEATLGEGETGDTSEAQKDGFTTSEGTISEPGINEGEPSGDVGSEKDGEIESQSENALRLAIEAHVAQLGWQPAVADGEVAGTTGRSLGLEALRVSLAGLSDEELEGSSVEMRALVHDSGWQDWQAGSAGTTGQGKAIEALQIRLVGELSERYDIWYRVHSAEFGWLGWAHNGESAGSDGYGRDVQAIEIALVPAGEGAPGSTDGAFMAPSVSFSSHIANVGWQAGISDDASGRILLGSTGQSNHLEAFTLAYPLLSSTIDGSVTYGAHVANIGWQSDVSSGAVAGTTGRNYAIEAVHFNLTGGLADQYDIWYRAHLSNIGWLGWTSNGQNAGSVGLSVPVEAVEVQLVPKGQGSPSGSGNAAFLEIPTLTYSAYAQGGWLAPVTNLGIAGTTGVGAPLEAFTISYSGQVPGSVSYRAHVSDVGWMDAAADGSVAGSPGAGRQVEAISISLGGEASRFFDIWYRVHVEGYGWLGWACNGQNAGTSKIGFQIEAIQIKVVGKGSAAPGTTSWSYFDYQHYIGWQNPPQYPQVSNQTVVLPSYCTGAFTYVTPSRIPYNATREDCVNAFIERAYEYLGTQYIEPWSTAPGGAVDCSGLVLQCLYATGMDLGWYNPYNHRWLPEQTYNSMNWYRNNTFMPVSVSDIKRGDVIYYSGHIAIYLGGGLIIDSWPRQGVTIQSINSRGRVIGAARPFVG